MGNKIVCTSTTSSSASTTIRSTTPAKSNTTTTTSATTTPTTTTPSQPKTKTPCYLAQPDDWPYVWAIRDVSIFDTIWKQRLEEELQLHPSTTTCASTRGSSTATASANTKKKVEVEVEEEVTCTSTQNEDHGHDVIIDQHDHHHHQQFQLRLQQVIDDIERNKQHDLPMHIPNTNIYLSNNRFYYHHDDSNENDDGSADAHHHHRRRHLEDMLHALRITKILNLAGPYAAPKTIQKQIQRINKKNKIRMKMEKDKSASVTTIQYKCIDAHDEEGYPLLKIHWKEIQEFVFDNSNNDSSSCSIDPDRQSWSRSWRHYLDACYCGTCCFRKTRNEDDATNGNNINKVNNGNDAEQGMEGSKDDYDENEVEEEDDDEVDHDQSRTKSTPNDDDANTNSNDNILIHCVAGQNRSVLIVAILHMLIVSSSTKRNNNAITNNTNVLETMLLLRRLRGKTALNNESFQEQLVSFARQNDLLGPKPGSSNCVVQKVPPPPSWRSNFHP